MATKSIAQTVNTSNFAGKQKSVLRDLFEAVRTAMAPVNTALVGTAAYNPGDLADGAGETTTGITVTGAALGDFVLVSFDKDLESITLTGWVSAANTVKARFQHESGGSVNLDAGNLYFTVIPRGAYANRANLGA